MSLTEEQLLKLKKHIIDNAPEIVKGANLERIP